MGIEENPGSDQGAGKETNKLQLSIELLGRGFIELFWNRDRGDEGGFVRKLLRAEMEDKGEIPSRSDED